MVIWVSVGIMGVMICLGQGGLHSLSASSFQFFLNWFLFEAITGSVKHKSIPPIFPQVSYLPFPRVSYLPFPPRVLYFHIWNDKHSHIPLNLSYFYCLITIGLAFSIMYGYTLVLCLQIINLYITYKVKWADSNVTEVQIQCGANSTGIYWTKIWHNNICLLDKF